MCYHEKQQSHAFKVMSDRFAAIGMIAITFSDGDEYATVFANPAKQCVLNAMNDLQRWHPGYSLTYNTSERLQKAGDGYNDAFYHWLNESAQLERSEAQFPSVEFGNLSFAAMALAFGKYGYLPWLIDSSVARLDFCRNMLHLTLDETAKTLEEYKKFFGTPSDPGGTAAKLDEKEARSIKKELESLVELAKQSFATADAIAFLEELPEIGFNDTEKAELASMLDERFHLLENNLERRVTESLARLLKDTRVHYSSEFGERLRLDLHNAIATSPSINALSSRTAFMADAVNRTGKTVNKTAKRVKKISKRLSK